MFLFVSPLLKTCLLVKFNLVKIMSTLKNIYPDSYSSDFINLDFHSISHYGDESGMEKI